MHSVLDTDEEDLLTEWLPGDEFGDCCQSSISALDEMLDGPVSSPGTYEIMWRR